MRKKHRIVLDANWYISACISRKSRRTLYYHLLKNPNLQIFYSSELMTEFDSVIHRPKFAKIVSAKQVHRFKTIAQRFLKEIPIGPIPAVVRDNADNYLLGICAACHADFLVTGDLDLLVLGKYEGTAILTMQQFLSEIR